MLFTADVQDIIDRKEGNRTLTEADSHSSPIKTLRLKEMKEPLITSNNSEL